MPAPLPAGDCDSAPWLALNRECGCWPVEPAAVVARLPASVRGALTDAHAHLFAQTGVFVGAHDVAAMRAQVRAIDGLARLSAYRAAVAERDRLSPEAEGQRTRGVLMGFDFHLTPTGPRLIEVNTNAGGAFLVDALAGPVASGRLEANAPLTANAPRGSRPPGPVRNLADMFAAEWRVAGEADEPETLVIVDDDPASQFLFADMVAAAESLRARFPRVKIANPEALRFEGGRLWLGADRVDMVYNRLTDFALVEPANEPLRRAWQSGRVVVSPAPQHHAWWANKHNLALFADAAKLRAWGATPEQCSALAGVPRTLAVSEANAEELWRTRRQWFFKPACGFGGRAGYRGARVTRKVFARVVAGDYVAQEFVPAAQRAVSGETLKFDVRVYAYAGEDWLMAARIYQGQTTNFRTAGGGFAPVLTEPSSVCENRRSDDG